MSTNPKLTAEYGPISADGRTMERTNIVLRAEDGVAEATFQVYRTNWNAPAGEWSRWHVVTTGRYFATLEDAGEYLVASWHDPALASDNWSGVDPFDLACERRFDAAE